MSDAHGRDHLTHAEMALDENGKILALKCETIANMGGYLSTFGAVIPSIFHGTMLSGVYAIPAIEVGVKAVFTNTCPTDAYRGAGRPEAVYSVERLIEAAALELGISERTLYRKIKGYDLRK